MNPKTPARPGRVAARLARQVELGLASVDLTLSQYRILILLVEGKEAASSLADKLAVSRPSVTAVVDGLVQRGAVEREFGRQEHEWGMLPLRVRRLPRVRLHVDLTILAQLASALAATRA